MQSGLHGKKKLKSTQLAKFRINMLLVFTETDCQCKGTKKGGGNKFLFYSLNLEETTKFPKNVINVSAVFVINKSLHLVNICSLWFINPIPAGVPPPL